MLTWLGAFQLFFFKKSVHWECFRLFLPSCLVCGR